jgi:hypothetical protein
VAADDGDRQLDCGVICIDVDPIGLGGRAGLDLLLHVISPCTSPSAP